MALCALSAAGCTHYHPPSTDSPAGDWCTNASVTRQNTLQFLQKVLPSTTLFRKRERALFATLQEELKEYRHIFSNQSTEREAQMFFARGDTFPSIRLLLSNGQKRELRLDPHLRSRGVRTIAKIAISPRGEDIALVGYVPSLESNLLITINAVKDTSALIATDVYDALWGDSTNLFFSTEDNLRPTRIYRSQSGAANEMIHTALGESQALLLSKSRDSSFVFIEASTPTHTDLFALSARSDFQRVFVRMNETPGARLAAIGDAIFHLSFKDTLSGVVTKVALLQPPLVTTILQGRPLTPITEIDTTGDLLLAFTAHGTSSSLTTVHSRSGVRQTIPSLGPITTMSPLPHSPFTPNDAISTSSFLQPTVRVSIYDDPKRTLNAPSPLCPQCSEISLTAHSADGAIIPISVARPPIVQGVVILAYGSYGRSLTASASPYVTALLHKDIAVAIAHVRGGGELGPAWHTAGSGPHKHKGIDDLVAVTRTLHRHQIGSPHSTVIEGRSAGGWLAATTASAHPELFKGVILEAPLLDLEGVTKDPSLPLNSRDIAEWGSASRHLSPLNSSATYAAKTLVIIPLQDELIPIKGTLEWVRQILCSTQRPEDLLIDAPLGEGHTGSSAQSDQDAAFALKLAFIITTMQATPH